MRKRVFIIHGLGGYPEEGWFPWLKKELEDRSFDVFVPQLPEPDEPRVHTWVSAINETVCVPDERTYFVGHSIGCQAIARYLETLPAGKKVGGVVFVAGFFKVLSNIGDNETMKSVAKEWLEAPLSLEKVHTHFDKSTAIFSDDDPYVPLDNQEEYRGVLRSKVIIEKNMGHFSGTTGTFELPVCLDALLEIAV